MWGKIKGWAKLNIRYLLPILCLTIVVFAAVMVWQQHTVQRVSPMPQQQAETPAGVEKAASNAHIKLDSGQTKQVSETIREIRVTEKEPVYIIQTTGDKAQEASERASKQEKADFSIVTDKDHQDEAVELDKLGKDTTVTLNQYNVRAYKKQLNTIEYMPQEKIIGYTHSWKISDSGHYIGAGVDYDWDDQKVMLKASYSW